MSNLVQFHAHLRAVHLAGQSAVADGQDANEQVADEPAFDADKSAALQQEAYEKGRREAEKKFEAKIKAANALQGQLLKRLEAAEQALVDSVEAALPDLVLEGVRRIIPKWEPTPEEIQQAIMEMVSSLEGESGALEIRLNERDKTHLDIVQDGLWSDFNGTGLVVDKSLKPGECVVAGRFGMVDGRFESKLNRLRKDLE